MSQALSTRTATTAERGPQRPQITAMTCDIPVVTNVRRDSVETVPGERVCHPTGRSLRRSDVRRGRVATPASRRSGLEVRRAVAPTARRSNVTSAVAERSNAEAVFRRRRTVAALAAGAVLAGIVWVLAVVGADYSDAVTPETPAVTEVVHVRSGESLTDVAARIAPELPAGGVVQQLRELNGLETSGLRVGQPLVVPAYR